MLISMVYTFTNEMQITFLKTVGGVLLTNEALCVQYNGKQYMILIYRRKEKIKFIRIFMFISV